MKVKTILLGISLIIIGFFITYFLGYKDIGLLGFLNYVLIFAGWLILVFSIFGKFYNDRKPDFLKNKILWIKMTAKNTAVIILAVFGVIVTLLIGGKMTNDRIQKILYTEPNNETVAEVVKLESRYTRGGWKIWAIFEYKTAKNKTYQKGIFNYKDIYKKGDKYYIIYSINYPEIMELEDKIE